MDPVKQKPERIPFADEPTEPDDVEILEIVGMDDDVVEVVPGQTQTAPEGRIPASLVEDAQRAQEEAEERLLRLRADFENFRKRIERERTEHSRRATASLVERLLPVLDNLERALANARSGVSAESLAEGVALTHRQLLEELRREGLRPVESLGREFDPSVHEAVAAGPSEEAPPNTVVEELQRGYHLGDRLLRPAMVRVAVGLQDGGNRGESGEVDG